MGQFVAYSNSYNKIVTYNTTAVKDAKGNLQPTIHVYEQD